MSKIRVLVVDDAVVVRRMVADLLAEDDAIEVVGTAPNGRIALPRSPSSIPIWSRSTWKCLRWTAWRPSPPSAAATPPARPGGEPVRPGWRRDHRGRPGTGGQRLRRHAGTGRKAAPTASECVREQLIPKIKRFAVAQGRPQQPAHAVAGPATGLPFVHADSSAPVEVVAIGASTGGPNALAEFLPAFPADFPVPTVIVQHMPPVFTERLAAAADAVGTVEVEEAESGAVVRPGRAWLAPGDFHLALARDAEGVRLRTHQGPAENSCRPSVDVLFRSAAEVYGPGVLAVVLTGMGQDGLRGCEQVRAAGRPGAGAGRGQQRGMGDAGRRGPGRAGGRGAARWTSWGRRSCAGCCKGRAAAVCGAAKGVPRPECANKTLRAHEFMSLLTRGFQLLSRLCCSVARRSCWRTRRPTWSNRACRSCRTARAFTSLGALATHLVHRRRRRLAAQGRRGHDHKRDLFFPRRPSFPLRASGGVSATAAASRRRAQPDRLVRRLFERPGALQRGDAAARDLPAAGRMEHPHHRHRPLDGNAGAGAARPLYGRRGSPRPAGAAAGEVSSAATARSGRFATTSAGWSSSAP